MKNLLKFYILIFSFCFAFSQEKSFKVTELTLDNGLKVMLTENSESSNVFGVVAVRAGGKNDPADATGIAHYLEHVLFKGTDKLGTNNYEKEEILLDSIALLYEDLSIAIDEITRNNIQSEINKLSVKAINKNVRSSSRKIALVLDYIRGKKADVGRRIGRFYRGEKRRTKD